MFISWLVQRVEITLIISTSFVVGKRCATRKKGNLNVCWCHLIV
jgi:hypothetical protein